jgi:hypothetical protein
VLAEYRRRIKAEHQDRDDDDTVVRLPRRRRAPQPAPDGGDSAA